VPATCQNGAETGDIDRHQDDDETGPDQHCSSRVSTWNRHGKEKVSARDMLVPATCQNEAETGDIETFPSWLCFAELQYVDGLGEFPGAPGTAAELGEDLPGQ
jgi:hypothetical protein